MMNTIATVAAAGLLGAQLVLTLVLLRGEICPGQRGRIHKVLWALVFSWLAIVPLQVWALLPFATLCGFAVVAKTGKTREKGPLPLLYTANILAAVVWVLGAMQSSALEVVAQLFTVGLVGSAISHLALIQARSRLQAFHRILPVTGIVSAIGLMLTMLAATLALPEAQLDSEVWRVGTMSGLLLVGILFWVAHIVTQKPAQKLLILGALVCVSFSSVMVSAFV
ncbi:hypothetical protein NF212_07420 [Parasalinivibrio latis]|uniref:hypothetical protein n=1 Tax=Parasalinivibrio latis TaxID=2952610 RepID=UPI0030E2F5F7